MSQAQVLQFTFMCTLSAHYYFWVSMFGYSVEPLRLVGTVSACFITYMLDRIKLSPEDKINKSKIHALCRENWVWYCITIIPIFLFTTVMVPQLALNALIATPLALFYSTDILPVRVKKLFLGSKNIYVSAMWTFWFFGSVGLRVPSRAQCNVLFLHFCQQLLSNVIMDMKDARGDAACGVQTVPSTLGVPATRVLVCGLLGVFGLNALLSTPIAFGTALLLFSLCEIALAIKLDLTDGLQAGMAVMFMQSSPCALYLMVR